MNVSKPKIIRDVHNTIVDIIVEPVPGVIHTFPTTKSKPKPKPKKNHRRSYTKPKQDYKSSFDKSARENYFKAIAFKLSPDQIKDIDLLITQQWFYSRSEVYRNAMYEFIDLIIFQTDDFQKPFLLADESVRYITQVNASGSAKEPTCAKIPTNLLKIVDLTISKITEDGCGITNRTDFIRLAVKFFLERNQQMTDDLNLFLGNRRT